MIRVTNNLLSNNFLKNVNEQKNELSLYQKKITSGNNINRPHENPDGTAKALMYRTQIEQYQRFNGNSTDALSRLNFIDAKLQDTKSYLDFIRDKLVQGSTGTYNNEDMKKMAVEVEQMLKQVIQTANSSIAGESVFAGFKTSSKAFSITQQNNPEFGEPVISNVQYKGDIGRINREIERGEYLEVNLPGNRAFWATNMRIISNTDVQGYTAPRDMAFSINDVRIDINAGDNLNMIIDKINQANIAVKAELDDTKINATVAMLQGTRPGQIVMEDLEGGTVLEDLGFIVSGDGINTTNNYNPSTAVYGESVFDVIIEARNALYKGDIEGVNMSIGQIDQAIDNVLTYNAEIGSRAKRAEISQERLTNMEVYAKDFYSKIQGLDTAEAITEMKNIQFMNEATLNIGSRLIPRTLLDFLR